MLRVFPHLNPFARLQGEEVFSSLYGFLLIAFAMYGRFLRIFLDLDQTYPKFNKSFIIFEKIFVPFGLLIFALGILSMQHYSIKLFSVLYILTLPFFLISFFYLGTRKRTINRIILTGTLLAVVIARSAAIQHYFSGNQNFQLINFQYIIASIVILFLFLNLGLLYKSKLIHLQNIQLEVQKESALSEQRAMISADLHDDLGASLSSIHLNGIMAQNFLLVDIPKTSSSLTRMVNDLKSVIENMGDIVWAINTHTQGHKSMSSQLKDFYFDLMDSHNIQCSYDIDEGVEDKITDINARKNILLIAKEAINNILKHAESSKVTIVLKDNVDHILLSVSDNGIGMRDDEYRNTGNGIRNMRGRVEKLKGDFIIKSEQGAGTTLSCIIPFTNIRYVSA